MIRIIKDVLAILFHGLAEAFDRLADACEDSGPAVPLKTNGRVEHHAH